MQTAREAAGQQMMCSSECRRDAHIDSGQLGHSFARLADGTKTDALIQDEPELVFLLQLADGLQIHGRTVAFEDSLCDDETSCQSSSPPFVMLRHVRQDAFEGRQ